MSSLMSLLGRRVAGVLIALLVGATALPPALHADMDDLACEYGAALSARATHVDDNSKQDESLHCKVCHWLRSIRAFDIAPAAAPAVTGIATTVEVVDALLPAATARVLRTSRAPPLF